MNNSDVILRVALRFVYEKDYNQLINLVIKELTKEVKVERISLFLYDDDQNILYTKVTQEKEGFSFSADEGIAGSVIRSKKMINVVDAYKHADFNQDIDKKYNFRTREILAAPLIDPDGEVVGLLELINKLDKTPFTVEDENLVEILSQFIAVALSNQERYNKLIRLEQAKSDFIFLISHELRTPLIPVLGFINLVESNVKYLYDPEKFDKYFPKVKIGMDRLNNVIDKILEFAELDAGYRKLDLETVNLSALINDTINNVSAYAKQKNINIINLIGQNPHNLRLAPNMIREVFVSILDNAIQFSNESSEVIVDFKIKKEFIIVSIKDFGKGIPSQSYHQVFDRFTQHANIMTHSKGIALSLAYCREIIKMHGGKLFFKSVVDEGTTFFIQLPFYLNE